jgi:ABC-type polysaccharide/polyol phosphate export permease
MNNQSLYFNGEEKTWRASFMLAMKDIKQGVFISLPIWNMLAWQDIKQRYRRSVIGPFWLTISTAIMVFSLGFFVFWTVQTTAC